MQTVKRLGADVGNDAVKIYLEQANYEGKDKLEIMNLVSPGQNRRIMGVEKGHLSNLLDVNIFIDGSDIGRYFVGGLAFKYSRNDVLEKSRRDVKALNIDTIILMMTAIAYSLYDPQAPVKTENVAIGTLLPTEEYWSEENLYDEFIKNFSKSYKVKFNSPSFNGAEISINIVDNDVQPESVAGHLTAIYERDGKVRAGIGDIANEVHLGIFIGSVTTEISVYENEEFNPNGLFGIELGTSEPLDKIIEDLGIDMTRHQIDHIIRTNKPLIVTNKDGKPEDITPKLNAAKERRFDYFVRLLVNRINKKLSKQGINTDLITRVNLGGGGAITTFDSFKKEFAVRNVALVPDARFANALGALISIIDKQSEQEVAAEEVLDVD
jgi:plasmid segregation protein ParM